MKYQLEDFIKYNDSNHEPVIPVDKENVNAINVFIECTMSPNNKIAKLPKELQNLIEDRLNNNSLKTGNLLNISIDRLGDIKVTPILSGMCILAHEIINTKGLKSSVYEAIDNGCLTSYEIYKIDKAKGLYIIKNPLRFVNNK